MGERLIEIQHQFPDGHAEFVCQVNCSTLKELTAATENIAKTHPLPYGAQWLFTDVALRDRGLAQKRAQEFAFAKVLTDYAFCTDREDIE